MTTKSEVPCHYRCGTKKVQLNNRRPSPIVLGTDGLTDGNKKQRLTLEKGRCLYIIHTPKTPYVHVTLIYAIWKLMYHHRGLYRLVFPTSFHIVRYRVISWIILIQYNVQVMKYVFECIQRFLTSLHMMSPARKKTQHDNTVVKAL